MHLGIDFGAKYAGTTAICFAENNKLVVVQSSKKMDADTFCNHWITLLKPEFVMIDAPLSLPDAYFGVNDNFFFRACDIQLQAMSPLFLGGLTARAMKLAHHWKKTGIQFFETYPKMLKVVLDKELSMSPSIQKYCIYAAMIERQTKLIPSFEQQSTHSCDALLAWYAGYRKNKGEAVFAGNEAEGVIWY